MRTSLLLFLVLIVAVATSFMPTDAEATPGPFSPATYLRFLGNEADIVSNEVNIVFNEVDIDSLENGELLLKLPHNFATTPGISGGTLSLGGSLPAKAYVTSVSIVVETDVISPSNNTLSLGCETANDLDVADDFSTETVNDVLGGEPRVGTESTWVYSATGCVPTMTVGAGTTGITAGRVIYLIKYLQAETQ